MTDSNPEMIWRGRLNGAQRGRLVRLLDMPYTPSELAYEIGFTVRQVYRVYIPLGCPCHKDTHGRRWINGKAFREWVAQTYQKNNMAEGQVFCKTCRSGVPIVSPTQEQKGRLIYLVCNCPYCGRRTVRIITKQRRHDK